MGEILLKNNNIQSGPNSQIKLSIAKGIQNIDPQTQPNNQNNLFYQDIEQQKSQ